MNIALQGSFCPNEDLWQQLRSPRHRNTIRQLVATRVLAQWRRILSTHIDTARLLARCVIEQDRLERQQQQPNEH